MISYIYIRQRTNVLESAPDTDNEHDEEAFNDKVVMDTLQHRNNTFIREEYAAFKWSDEKSELDPSITIVDIFICSIDGPIFWWRFEDQKFRLVKCKFTAIKLF